MPLLSEKDISYIKDTFDKRLVSDVELTLFIDKEDECDYCQKTAELLRELSAISPKLRLEVGNISSDKARARSLGIDKAPGLLVSTKEKKMHVCYFGIPAGYQFSALLDDIIDISNGKTRLALSTVEKLKEVKKPVEISVFVSISEELCAGAVRIAHQFAMENEKIWAGMIDAEKFTELAIHNAVTKVPKVVINGIVNFEEPLPESEFLEYVMSVAE